MILNRNTLRPVTRLRGGIKLPHNKNTAFCESVIMPPPKTVSIPLLQNIGAPCTPTVKKGDRVFVGTLIGDSDKPVSSPVHSSVSGTVTEIAEKKTNGSNVTHIVIESDGEMTPDPEISPRSVTNKEELREAARLSGLVGLGGAGFPTHIKLNIPDGKKIDTLIINGAECEPYITSDNREVIENYEDILGGINLIKDIIGVSEVIIGVESNKPNAINKLVELAESDDDDDDVISVMKLPSKYPQGAEKMLIKSVTGLELPLGKLPSDLGCIVLNITSIGVLYRFVKTGMPLVSKRITLDGTAVENPKNIIAPIGTSVKDILEFAGESLENADKIIIGGPMMGNCAVNEDFVLEKRTGSVLLMKKERPQKSTPCIRCGRCVKACPMSLYPASVEAAYNMGQYEKFKALNVSYCLECGSCAYVCPAKRPLTQVMRIAKNEVRRIK